MRRTEVLNLMASISRLSGGPFESVRRLSQNVALDDRFDAEIYGMADTYSGLDSAVWSPLRVRTFPLSMPRGLRVSVPLRTAVLESSADLLHVHGLWTYTSLVALSWSEHVHKPRMISPRGMLDPWALRNSRWKKRVAARLYENQHMRGAACIHALSDAEHVSIRMYGLTTPVCVIPNGVDVDLPDDGTLPVWTPERVGHRRVLLFLGRLHAKKGLANLIAAWRAVSRDSRLASDWALVIVGWEDGDFGRQIRKETDDSSIVWAGAAFGAQKWACYRNADAFVLPSFSEGLPMSVLEAWSCGLPSLITPQCNFPEAYDLGAAIRIESNVTSIAEGLRVLLSSSPEDRATMGRRATNLVRARYSWTSVGARMREVYQWLVQGGPTPISIRLAGAH